MNWLLDTNVLLRLADEQSPDHSVAAAAIEHLLAGEESVFIATQVLVEFWAVVTQPESANGLGWSTVFRWPASIRTMPAWRLCFSRTESAGY